jgi:NAD-dependent dihydropyrimidine dehydrogenase PreA subunit
MECIDFCLFGVYGLDSRDTLIVEQPDNCRKGCPACSRVCPENAILFPQHKSPAIAGGAPDRDGRKIDLSHLFGAPESAAGAIDLAARERDEHLLASGRPAVGRNVSIPPRPDERPVSPPPDDLDQLLDQLDALDL